MGGFSFNPRAVSQPGGTAALRRTGSFMFLCQLCGACVPPRVPAARVIVRRRPKKYLFRFGANVFRRPDPDGKIKERTKPDPGGVGWEIEREALACPRCAELEPPDG